MRLTLLAFVLLLAHSAQGADQPRVEFDAFGMRTLNALDLNAELGRISSPDGALWARARAGRMWVREPHVFSLGFEIEGAFRRSTALGAQAEWTHLQSGVWVQATLGMDFKGRIFGNPSLGWSVFGVERRTQEGAWLLKLRVPIGVLLAL
jgi:hypothetical protein